MMQYPVCNAWLGMLFGGKRECLVMEAPRSIPEREREREKVVMKSVRDIDR